MISSRETNIQSAELMSENDISLGYLITVIMIMIMSAVQGGLLVTLSSALLSRVFTISLGYHVLMFLAGSHHVLHADAW